MAKDRQGNGAPPESVISIIGPGMKVIGDCESEGTIRIEGTVEGSVRASKAVVVGVKGLVDGHIITQDAVISGRVVGTLVAESRLELQESCRIDGEVHARRMQLTEGAILNGTVQMGEKAVEVAAAASVEATGKKRRASKDTEVPGPVADETTPDATGTDKPGPESRDARGAAGSENAADAAAVAQDA